MDNYTLSIANAWITNKFIPYYNALRDEVYNWIINNKNDTKSESILAAYSSDNLSSYTKVEENVLNKKFGSLTSFDILSMDTKTVIRENINGQACSIKKRKNNIFVKPL